MTLIKKPGIIILAVALLYLIGHYLTLNYISKDETFGGQELIKNGAEEYLLSVGESILTFSSNDGILSAKYIVKENQLPAGCIKR